MGEAAPGEGFLWREWDVEGAFARSRGAEAFLELGRRGETDTVPAIGENGHQSAKEHHVLHARLETLGADSAVEDAVGSTRRGL